jgi:hypothetical protein
VTRKRLLCTRCGRTVPARANRKGSAIAHRCPHGKACRPSPNHCATCVPSGLSLPEGNAPAGLDLQTARIALLAHQLQTVHVCLRRAHELLKLVSGETPTDRDAVETLLKMIAKELAENFGEVVS